MSQENVEMVRAATEARSAGDMARSVPTNVPMTTSMVAPPSYEKPRVSRASRSGASRARTGDLLGAIQALSQLSYSPGASRLRR
jgi:hypothetical protein